MKANYETKVKPGTLGLLPYMTEREGMVNLERKDHPEVFNDNISLYSLADR